MTRRVALFGGSFNPPALHQRAIAARLAEEFDAVVIVPFGRPPGGPQANEAPASYRAAMIDMTFAGLDRVRVDLADLEARQFTPAARLEERFASEGEVWHVVRGELVAGGGAGQSAVQREWEGGPELWKSGRFVVVAREDRMPKAADLPPQHQVVGVPEDGQGLAIRSEVYHRGAFAQLLSPSVAAFIERHGLYRGAPTPRFADFPCDQFRVKIVKDESNPLATSLAEELAPYASDDPNLIVVIGGDGTMLRAIRHHWRERIPFYGINTGHLGFLLNHDSPLACRGHELLLCHVPLLYCEVEKPDGEHQTSLAFNDCWVERMTGQTAWIEVRVDGQVRMPQLVADGALVATAAGSTSYARAMGATPVPLNTQALLLVGSNVLRPLFWRPVVLPLESELELRTLDPAKRPLEAYIDGVEQGEVRWLKARVSNIAAVELVFAPGHDPAAKLARIQFPG